MSSDQHVHGLTVRTRVQGATELGSPLGSLRSPLLAPVHRRMRTAAAERLTADADGPVA
jgi:hypothetical protein